VRAASKARRLDPLSDDRPETTTTDGAQPLHLHKRLCQSNLREESTAGGPQREAPRPGECFRCGEPGHWANACPEAERGPERPTGFRGRSLACQPALPGDALGALPVVSAKHNVQVRAAVKELATLYSAQEDYGTWRKMVFDRFCEKLHMVDFELRTYDDCVRAWEVMERDENPEGGAKAGAFQDKSCFKVLAELVENLRGCAPGEAPTCQRIVEMRAAGVTLAQLALQKIWGVGPETAKRLAAAGLGSVAALQAQVARDDEDGVPNRTLTAQQRVGLRHLDDLQQRIPRAEVQQIFETVRAAAQHFVPASCGLRAEACGSFRRGAASSGDVDVLLTVEREDGDLLNGLLNSVVQRLTEQGFVTSALTNFDGNECVNSWMGVVRLPQAPGAPPPLFRRLDLKVYTIQLWPFALLYFTGSDHFNRSMRYYADRYISCSLSDKGLVPAVRRTGRHADRKKGDDPRHFPATCEEDIFRWLRLRYVPPEHRSV
jgi:DNA polymerase/3'-5' exonuclease PolX